MGKIGIIGVGKLGLCFALNAERKGFKVEAYDIHKPYIKSLQDKSFTSTEPYVNKYLKEAKNIHFHNDIKDIIEASVNYIFVFVATPSIENGGYDHSQIEQIKTELIALGKQSSPKHLIIGATTMPGYCNELQKDLEAYNYTVSYNPEFIAQGSIIKNQQFPDQILIGEANAAVGNEIEAIFNQIIENEAIVLKMDRLSAEIAKIATNCFLTTKISFANSIGDLAIKAGADKDKILAAIGADSRIGNKYLNYGFGFGGPCFPRDNRALEKFAENNNYELLISKATDEVNKRHLEFQFQDYLNKYNENENIWFDGVAYKKDTDFIDESQQLLLAVKLAQAGRNVIIHDNKTVIDQVEKNYPNLFIFKVKEPCN